MAKELRSPVSKETRGGPLGTFYIKGGFGTY